MAISVEELIREREESASVAYQKFVLLMPYGNGSLFCFFENKDAPYYHSRIKQFFGGSTHYIPCGNKKMVLKTHTLLVARSYHQSSKVAFFVDRDFDSSIKGQFQQVYETPCYSIENLYCGIDSFIEFLRTDLQIDASDSKYEAIINLYSQLQSNFINASLLINAWYILQKRKCHEGNIVINIRLPDSLIPAFVGVSLDAVVNKYNLETLNEKYPNALPITQEEIEYQIDELIPNHLVSVLRGKFLFNFLTHFIRMLVEDGADENRRNVVPKRLKYNMDNSMALSLLTTYAQTPACLREFLIKYNH